MEPNVNPETCIRYGIISANNLHPEIVDEIQRTGRNVLFEDGYKEMDAALRRALDGHMPGWAVDDVAELAWQLYEGQEFDEPVHEFKIECPGFGFVEGRTTWLGGALMVWIFKSPFTGAYEMCSPCVPGCGNLDAPWPGTNGEVCYDVPADWRYHE